VTWRLQEGLLRNIFRISLLAIAAGSLVPSPALAESVVLDQNSKWSLESSEEFCRLSAQFGPLDDPTVLQIMQFMPDDRFTWTIAGPNLKNIRWNEDVAVRWGDAAEPITKDFPKATLEPFGNALQYTNWSLYNQPKASKAEDTTELLPYNGYISFVAASTIKTVSLEQDGRFDQTLGLADFGGAVAALNGCTNNFLNSWGLDPDHGKKISTTASLLNYDEISKEIKKHYPKKAIYRADQASFQMRTIVGTDGKAEDCHWLKVTQAQMFDMKRSPCDIVMENALFESATDKNGKPMRSFYHLLISYRMLD
jgi:hypothetical protein